MMYSPTLSFLFYCFRGDLCIVHAARAGCLPRSSMILSVRSTHGNAPAAESCWIPPFLQTGLKTTISSLVNRFNRYCFHGMREPGDRFPFCLPLSAITTILTLLPTANVLFLHEIHCPNGLLICSVVKQPIFRLRGKPCLHLLSAFQACRVPVRLCCANYWANILMCIAKGTAPPYATH